MRPPRLPYLLVALAALSPVAAADDPAAEPARILLLDGRTLEGRDLLPRGSRLGITTKAGEETVDLADVLEASPGGRPGAAAARTLPLAGPGAPLVDVELLGGDRLRGALTAGTGEAGFVVTTTTLGRVPVLLEQVAAVRFPDALSRTEDPPPVLPGEKADRLVFASGDRIEGTLRSVGPSGVRVRTVAGEDRTVPLEGLLGFALLPLGEEPEPGLRVRLALEDGSLASGRSVTASGEGWLLQGMGDGLDRTVPAKAILGLSVRGGRGTPLPDLRPAEVTVKSYWGDGAPFLSLRPVADRAFTLERGPGPPLRLGGRTYLRGLSMFSGTTVAYDLEGKGFGSFVAAVGVDDGGPKGAVEFEVRVDGKSAWRSGVVRALPPGGAPLEVPPIPLAGARRLELVVHAGPGDDVQDYADWVRAVLLP